jgi:hypothetical protein
MSIRSMVLVYCVMFACSSQAKLHTRGRGIMTWYSFEDNESTVGSFDNKLKPFVSVARSHSSRVPLHARLFIPKLKGFPMGNGKRHDGWVRVDDECRGSGCKYLDLYVGSNAQRDRYRKWMRSRCKCDPDQLNVIAYTV